MNFTRLNILIGLLLLAAALSGCDERRPPRTASSADSTSLPDSEASGTIIHLFNRGNITAEIRSERIVQFEERDSTMGYVLDIDFFDSLGEVSSHLVGDSGVIRERTGHLEVFGHVVVNTANQTRLTTEYLVWDQRIDLVHTDAFVRIARPGDTVSGYGLEAPGDLSRFTILNQISGSVSSQE